MPLEDLIHSEDTITLTPREEGIAKGETWEGIDDGAAPPEPEPEGGDPGDGDMEIEIAPEGEEPEGTPDPADDPKDGEDKEVPPVDAGDDGDDKPWYGEEDLELAESYGIDEKELATFSDAEDFRQKASIIDRHLIAHAPVPKEPEPTPKATETAPPSTDEEASAASAIDPESYRDKGYNDEIVELAKFAKDLGQKFEAVTAAQTKADEEAQRRAADEFAVQFHDHVDTMDEGLFGRSLVDGKVADLGKVASANRVRLLEHADLISDALEARAEKAGIEYKPLPMPVLMERASRLAFGDMIRERDRQQYASAIVEQSKKRRPAAKGAGTTKPSTRNETNDPVMDIVNDPNLVSMWDNFQEENGA